MGTAELVKFFRQNVSDLEKELKRQDKELQFSKEEQKAKTKSFPPPDDDKAYRFYPIKDASSRTGGEK